MEGYLRKQDHTALVKGWKKRYFRLALSPPATLYYYKESNSKEPIDGVPLANTKIYEHSLGDKKTEGLVFVVETKDRQYILAADSKSELQQWMSNLQRAAAPPPTAAPIAVKQTIAVKQAVRPPSTRSAGTPPTPGAPVAKDEFADDMAKMMDDLMKEERSRAAVSSSTTSAAAPAATTGSSLGVPGATQDAGARRAARAGSRMATDMSRALADPNAFAAMEAEASAATPAAPAASPRRGATLLGSRGKPPALGTPPPPPVEAAAGLPPPSTMAPAAPSVPTPAPTSPRKPSTDTGSALIGERIGERKPSMQREAPPSAEASNLKNSQERTRGGGAPAPEPSLKTSQTMKPPTMAAPPPPPPPAEEAQPARSALKSSQSQIAAPSSPAEVRKVSIAGPPPSVAAPAPTSPRSRGGEESGTMIGRRRTAVLEEPIMAPPPTKKDSVGATTAAAAAASAASAPATAPRTTNAPPPATATATAAGEKRGARGTFLAGNRRATVLDKAALEEVSSQINASRSGTLSGDAWNSGRKDGEAENISPNLPMPTRRAARLQLGAQREEEDFFHLHKDDSGYYLLETPWQFRCFLRRLEEGGEGSDEEIVRVSLQGLLLERIDDLWMLNPSGYHAIGPRSQEPFAGDPAECLFELNGGITVRYNRGKWELLDAYVAESTAARVVQEQELPTIAYKIRNYKTYPTEVKTHLSELDDAVDLINQHFEAATDPEQWHALGDEEQTPVIGELVRRRLAGALSYALSFGFNSSKGFFSGNNHIWHFFDSFLERTSFRQLSALGLVRILRAVNAAVPADDLDGKLRAFVCSALNSGLLHEYMQLLSTNDEGTEKFFQAQSMLRTPVLLNELVQSLEPLSVFTFKLKCGVKADEGPRNVEPAPLVPVEQLWAQLGADVETNEHATGANASSHEEVMPYVEPSLSSQEATSLADSSGSKTSLGSDRSASPGRMGMAGTSPQRQRPSTTSPQRERVANQPPMGGVSPQRERPGVSPQRERPTVQLKETPQAPRTTSPQRERIAPAPQPVFDAPPPPPPPPAAEGEGLLSSLGKSLSNWWG